MNPVYDGVPEISVEALHQLLASGAAVQVVDVREDWEWARGHIAGAMHIPLVQLPDRLGELDAARDVAFICHLGGRSAQATRLGLARGLAGAVNVAGGMDAWEARAFSVE